MTSNNAVDAARVELFVERAAACTAIKLTWAALAARADEGGLACRPASCAALAEHENVADQAVGAGVERHLASARLPAGKTFDTFDFNAVPMVSKAQVMALRRRRQLARSGCQYPALWPTPGRGKSHLAAALGLALVQNWPACAVHPHHRPCPAAAGGAPGVAGLEAAITQARQVPAADPRRHRLLLPPRIRPRPSVLFRA